MCGRLWRAQMANQFNVELQGIADDACESSFIASLIQRYLYREKPENLWAGVAKRVRQSQTMYLLHTVSWISVMISIRPVCGAIWL